MQTSKMDHESQGRSTQVLARPRVFSQNNIFFAFDWTHSIKFYIKEIRMSWKIFTWLGVPAGTLTRSPSSPPLPLFFSLGRSCLDYQAQDSKSSLSKTLAQVLRDPVALPYFTQYMELHRMEHLVRFWLEAEAFRSTTWSRIRAHSLNTVKHSSLAEPVSPCPQQQDPPGFPPFGESLNGGLDDRCPTEPSPACLNRPTLTLRNHLLLGQGGDTPPLGLTLSEDECPVPTDSLDASMVSASSRNSPSFALRDMSGKLMKSKPHPGSFQVVSSDILI